MRDRIILLVAMTLTLLAVAAQAQTAQESLWDASKVGDTVTMATALADGAKLDSLDTRRSRNGRYALNYAAWFNQPEAIVFLLNEGAAVEAENITGFSALHHAAENGSLEATITLLEAGADPNHANKSGWLPADTAGERGYVEIADLLLAAMKASDD